MVGINDGVRQSCGFRLVYVFVRVLAEIQISRRGTSTPTYWTLYLSAEFELGMFVGGLKG